MIELLNCDCMELMAKYPDKHFDLAIVDPPYGLNIASREKIGGRKNERGTVHVKKDWDLLSPNADYFKELFRVSKNQIIWGANHFISKIPYDSSCWLIWDKDVSGDFADAELAWTSFPTAVRKYKFAWS